MRSKTNQTLLAIIAILLLIIGISEYGHADTIDTALIDNPDGTATAVYGCESWTFDDGQIVMQCYGNLPAYAYTPMNSRAPMVVFGVLADQYEYWPSTGACVMLSHTFGTFGQNQYEVSCGDVIARGGFDE